MTIATLSKDLMAWSPFSFEECGTGKRANMFRRQYLNLQLQSDGRCHEKDCATFP